MNWHLFRDEKPEPGSMVLVFMKYLNHNQQPQYLFDIAYYNYQDGFTIGSDIGQPWNPQFWSYIPNLSDK